MRKQKEAEDVEPTSSAEPGDDEPRPEGSEDGGAEVRVARRSQDGKTVFQQYHLQRTAGGFERVYHDTPPGMVMDKDGRLHPESADGR